MFWLALPISARGSKVPSPAGFFQARRKVFLARSFLVVGLESIRMGLRTGR